jgi:hypothetical protein
MATDAPPVPEHRVSLWKRALLGVLLFAAASFVALWIAGLSTVSTGRGALGEILAEIERDDPRWRWESLEEDLPDLSNVDNSVLRCREVVRSKGQSPWQPKELQTAAGEELLGNRPMNVRLDPERLAILRRALAKQPRALALALSLKDLPRGRATIHLTPDVIGTLLPDAQNPRDVTHLLELDSERLLHDGQAEGVADRLRASLHGGAGLRGSGFLISQLVRFAIRAKTARMAERALGLGELSGDACRRLADHFAAEREENLLLDGMRGERATMHILFENLQSGKVSLADFFIVLQGRSGPLPDALMRGGAVLYGPRLYEDHASMMRWMHRACKISALPPHQQPAEWATYEKEVKAFVAESRRSFRNMVTVMILPAVAKVSEAGRRDEALLACTQAALAAERFRLANTRWPATLDELRPEHLKEVPTDPFTGKPLLLARTEDGAVIYSVGQDGKDDGGESLSLAKKAGTDLGVRLWNPERRGLEPLKMPTPNFEPLKMPQVE